MEETPFGRGATGLSKEGRLRKSGAGQTRKDNQVPSSEEIQRELDQLLTAVTDESVGSIDHATNAKVIALKDSGVRDKLVGIMSEGHRLKSITPLVGYGASPMDFRLRFHFESDALVDLSQRDFIASVELPSKSVKRILDDQTEGTLTPIHAPFSLAVPSLAREYKTPVSELQARTSVERQFLGSLSIGTAVGQVRRQGYNVQALESCDTLLNTPQNTITTTSLATNASTTTFSDGVADDEQNDFQPDWVNDVQSDNLVDAHYDCI